MHSLLLPVTVALCTYIRASDSQIDTLRQRMYAGVASVGSLSAGLAMPEYTYKWKRGYSDIYALASVFKDI